MVYAHQHKIILSYDGKTSKSVSNQAHTVIQGKCAVCDAMHHTNAIVYSHFYFSPKIVTNHFYKVYNYDFISIALVLSAGRAPPALAFC